MIAGIVILGFISSAQASMLRPNFYVPIGVSRPASPILGVVRQNHPKKHKSFLVKPFGSLSAHPFRCCTELKGSRHSCIGAPRTESPDTTQIDQLFDRIGIVYSSHFHA